MSGEGRPDLATVDARQLTLAIAAAQSGGLQRNFGTMTKPLQAGLAAQDRHPEPRDRL